MDPRLLKYYNRELQHLREVGGEFAAEFPKIAGRLSLDGFECADPYVERLLEGFAFLAARVQLRIDSEFPRFTQHLFEMVYPHYLAPTPSTAVVQFKPDLKAGSLTEGFTVPRQSSLRSLLGKGDTTACEFRTAFDCPLWPIEIAEAEYFVRDASSVEIPNIPNVRAGVRIRLRTAPGITFNRLALQNLTLFIRGAGQYAMQIYEQVLGSCVGLVARPAIRPAPWQQVLDASHVRRVGWRDEEALFPYAPPSFQGYRLLQEYFSCPQKFLFAELTGLGPAVKRCTDNQLDLLLLFDRSESRLNSYLNADNFALFCTPAVNLFPKSADRIHLDEHSSEHHVVPDRTRPLDYEVYQITGVSGFGVNLDEEQRFHPFYSMTDEEDDQRIAYYTVQRSPRLLSSSQRKTGPRSSYIGTEVYLALVDAAEAPYRHDLRQLAVSTLCTNRDLPLHMPVGQGDTDFHLASGAPIEAIHCLAGPSRPRTSPLSGDGDFVWRLVSHLSLNYLSLVNNDERKGAAALRDLLQLYADYNEPAIRKQIEGVRTIAAKPVTRPIPTDGPLTFGRGTELTVTCDESAFEGTGVFLLGMVLDEFFARYVSLNSFTEMVLATLERGQVKRWPVRIGRRPTL